MYVLLIAVFCVFIFSLLAAGFNTIYLRHIKSYSIEIDSYLKEQKLNLKSKRKPNSSDWDNAPFERTALIEIGLGPIITIAGMHVSIRDEKFLVIDTLENARIWLKIETIIFSKPKLTFKKHEYSNQY